MGRGRLRERGMQQQRLSGGSAVCIIWSRRAVATHGRCGLRKAPEFRG